MSEVRKNAMNFEAVKVSMSQNKEGVILRLSVNPLTFYWKTSFFYVANPSWQTHASKFIKGI